MIKKLIMLLSLIVIVNIVIIFLYNNTNKEYVEIDGVKYAILVNGLSVSSFPSGNYEATVSCINATGYWDYQEEKVIIKNITGNPSCDISFTSITSNSYLNNYIMGLSGTTQGTGKVVNENGIRYEGKNPNNYVYFNNELWRIIGVFDSSSHGRSGENLVKLIRAYSIGEYAWNESHAANDWSNSTLYRMLNGCYLYQKKGNETINLTGQSGLCSAYSVLSYSVYNNTSSPGKSDFSQIGIKQKYRNMIVDATWYLGGIRNNSNVEIYVNTSYNYERSGEYLYVGNPASTTGKIGLMYVSDYGYSVLSSSCSRSKYPMYGYSDHCYDVASCGSQSWLYGSGNEWAITPDNEYPNYAWYIAAEGHVTCRDSSNTAGGVHYGRIVRPVLYLSEYVYRVSGTGTATDPYIIGM